MFDDMKTGHAVVDHRATPRQLGNQDLEHMRLPKTLWFVTMDRVPENVRGVLEAYSERMPGIIDEGVSILLQGVRGVGKSSAAAIIARRARAWRRTVLFTTYTALRDARRSKTEVLFDSETQTTLWQRARDVAVLVLDNVSTEDMDDAYYGQSEFVRLLEDRAGAGKVTIVTTREIAVSAEDDDFPGVLLATVPKMIGLTLQGPNQTLQNNQALVMGLANTKK